MRDWINHTHVGDCRQLMRQMSAAGIKVNCIVTSPPYWGLRDYGVSGQYGTERTYQRHVARMRGVFRQCRSLLERDGVLWLNYGDSYYTPRPHGGHGASSKINGRNQHEFARAARMKKGLSTADGANRRRQVGLKEKDMVGMPWRIAFALQSDGWYLRSDVIWHKPNPMPESMRDRPTKSHEYLFLMSKSKRYYYDWEAISEPCSPDTHARAARGRSKAHKNADGGPGDQTIAKGDPHGGRVPTGWDTSAGEHRNKVGRYKGDKTKQDGTGNRRTTGFNDRYFGGPKSVHMGEAIQADHIPTVRNARTVWSLVTEGFPGAHFATFPTELVKRCILAGSKPGDIIFDPFHGSGTVGKVAIDLGRRFIGCELNPDYAEMADHRSRNITHGLPL